MVTSEQLLLIIGMGLVTYIPRALPIVLFANHEVSPSVKKWLSYIPSAVFAALVFVDVFFWEGTANLSLVDNKKLLPSVIVLLVALKTKSLAWSIVSGILALSVWLYLF